MSRAEETQLQCPIAEPGRSIHSFNPIARFKGRFSMLCNLVRLAYSSALGAGQGKPPAGHAWQGPLRTPRNGSLAKRVSVLCELQILSMTALPRHSRLDEACLCFSLVCW